MKNYFIFSLYDVHFFKSATGIYNLDHYFNTYFKNSYYNIAPYILIWNLRG